MRIRSQRTPGVSDNAQTPLYAASRFVATAALLVVLLGPSQEPLVAQSAAGAQPAAAAQPMQGTPALPSAESTTPAPNKPLDSPNLLDGLESLKIANDPDFSPPIVDAEEIFSGQPHVGGASSTGSQIKGLEPDFSTPDLNAPVVTPSLEATALNAPNETLPSLEIPNVFGPTMTGSPLGTLAAPLGPSLQHRPLGTLGIPSFMSTKHSVAVGGSRVRFGASIDAGAAYNNNVFATPSNPQGDLIFSLQPTIYLETGKKGTMQFLWSPSVLRYAKYRQFNSVNQTFLFSSRYRWSKLRVGLDASYLAQSGLFLNSQGQAQQKAVYARMFAGYSLTKKTEMFFDFAGTVTESNPGGRQFQGTFTAAVDYRYSRKTTFGAAVALGYFTSSAGTTTSESFLLRLLYNPTSKLMFRGEGGFQFRQSSSTIGSSSAVTSVMNASLIYSPSSKTYVSLRFFRNVDMDAFNAGNLQITTSVEGMASWKIYHSLTFDAALAAGRVENVAMNGRDLGTYNYVQGNLALTYLLTDEVNVKLFNNLQQRINDTQGNNYMSNTSGMSLGMRF